MSRSRFVAWLILVLVWIPGMFAAYLWWLFRDTHAPLQIFIGVGVFIYAILVPNIIHFFWDELAALFAKKADGHSRSRGRVRADAATKRGDV